MPTDPFVDAAALPSLGPIRYLDARDQAAFEAGHAPNAIRAPADAWDKSIKTADIGFENTAFWSEALTGLGVGPGVTAVVYDTGAMTNAARVWFVLQYYGMNCVIVNGGWPAIAAAYGLPMGDGPVGDGPVGDGPVGDGPVPAAFHAMAGAGSVGVVDRQTLKTQLDGAAQVFDSRTRAEYTGEDARGRPRGGHLPGARHLSHVDLMTNGVVHAPPVLRSMLEGAGFGPGGHIVTHCEGGGRAAFAAAAAVRAGFKDVRVYYLSFKDWAEDPSCPIVTT